MTPPDRSKETGKQLSDTPAEGMVGVDEAGRGPALGSMFVAGVYVPSPDDLPAGMTDSKRLGDGRREQLSRTLEETSPVAVAVREVPAEEIDRHAGRLNQLTARSQAAVIDDLVAQASDEALTCVVDACDVDEARFARLVEAAVTTAAEIRAEHGADDTYPIVGAASVLAKSRRERHVETLADRYGEIGSGYPSDETTRSFLERYVAEQEALPDCARRTWKPCQELLAANEQETLDGT